MATASPLFSSVLDCRRNIGELLDRRNDDGHAVGQSFGELLRVFVDLLDHAFFVLKLINGVLQLLVENQTISDHDDGIENLADQKATDLRHAATRRDGRQ